MVFVGEYSMIVEYVIQILVWYIAFQTGTCLSYDQPNQDTLWFLIFTQL